MASFFATKGKLKCLCHLIAEENPQLRLRREGTAHVFLGWHEEALQQKQNVRFIIVRSPVPPLFPSLPLFLRFATWAAICLEFIATHPVNKPSHRALSDLARRVGPIRPPATRPPVDHDLHNSPRVCRRSPRPAQSGCQVPWPVVPRRPDSYPEY